MTASSSSGILRGGSINIVTGLGVTSGTVMLSSTNGETSTGSIGLNTGNSLESSGNVVFQSGATNDGRGGDISIQTGASTTTRLPSS